MGDTSSPAEPASKKPRIEEPSPSKLEKAQADYDQACKAYSELQQRLFDAAEKQPRDEVQVQILQNALANAKEREEFARRMLEVEMKNVSQSEASEVAKKCLLFQFLTGCVVSCLKHAVILGLKGIGLFMFWFHQCIRCPFLVV